MTNKPVNMVKLGSELVFSANGKITAANLICYSGATYTVNNNQRRVKLTLLPVTTAAAEFQYRVKVPSKASVAIPGY
jgi:hypothetical protein